MTTVTKADIRENMKENYRIVQCDPVVIRALGQIKSEGIKLLFEQLFYLGYVYGAEWASEKIKSELPNELIQEMRTSINKVRDGDS